MFLPWSFFSVVAASSLFKFLLECSVGATLALYSRFGGEYANSIRWVCQGGYLEMYNTLVNSRESIPSSTKLVLVVTILASFTASIADVAAVYFVTSATQQTNAGTAMITTSQQSPLDDLLLFRGWSTSISHDTNITSAMARMINETRNIPSSKSGRLYIPRTSEYQVVCNRLDFCAWDSSRMLSSRKGCAMACYAPTIGGDDDPTKATVVRKSNSRASVSLPTAATPPMIELFATLNVTYGSTLCGTWDMSSNVMDVPTGGISSLPTTTVSKCVVPTGEVLVNAMTSIRFYSLDARLLVNSTLSLFPNDDDELVRAMGAAMKQATFLSSSTLFMEFKLGDTGFDVLSCYSFKQGKARPIGLDCMYSAISIVLLKQQALGPIVTAASISASFPPPPEASIAMSLSHIPIMTNTSTQHLSPSKAKKTSFEAGQYMASLGQNFYADWDKSKLYVLYDTTDAQDGFDIPGWLVVGVLISMGSCAVLCGLTQYLLDERHTGSLYKVMSLQLAETQDARRYAPMIRWSKSFPDAPADIPVALAEGTIRKVGATMPVRPIWREQRTTILSTHL